LELKEHESASWLPISRLRDVNWLPADLLVVDRLEKQADHLMKEL
jgi:8-oxo-dGTP diphosphatase